MLKGKRTYSAEEKLELWDKFNRSEITDVQVSEAYLDLVEIIASSHKNSLPDTVEYSDLISEGYFGLLDAVNKYDQSVGAKFETYATSRIRGTIYDSLRDYDHISRYYRKKFKIINQTIQALSEEFMREPTNEELAKVLDWDADEISKLRYYYNNSFTVNIDDYMNEGNHESFSLKEFIIDESIGDPNFSFQKEKIIDNLNNGFLTLTESEKIVVYLRHYDNMSFIDIARVSDIKKTEISSIYASAISKLEKALKE